MSGEETARRRRQGRKATQANVRKAAVAMDSRDNANSTAMKGLLERQLASISDTLAKASRRRDAEVQRRTACLSSATPTARTDLTPVDTDVSIMSDTAKSGSSLSGSVSDRVVFTGRDANPSQQPFGRFDRDLQEDKTIMGWIQAMPERYEPWTDICTDLEPQPALRGGHSTNDEDPTHILGRLDLIDPATRADDIDPKEILAHFNKSAPITDAGISEEELREGLTQMLRARSPSDRRNRTLHEIDPVQALADFDCRSSSGSSIVREESAETVPEQLLTALEHGLSYSGGAQAEATESMSLDSDRLLSAPPLATATTWEARLDKLLKEMNQQTDSSDNNGGDTRSMFADLEREASLDNNDDPERMLAELKREARQEDVSDGSDISFEALRTELTNIFSLALGRTSPASDSADAHNTSISAPGKVEDEATLDRLVMRCVIAIKLEMAGFPWEWLQGWTRYLFSSGLDGYKARREKDAIVKQAEEELEATIEWVMEEDKRYRSLEEKACLPCRLIVSNIAADATVEDLKEFFYPHRFHVQEIKMSPIRVPVRRTQVAHVDMMSRKHAIQASFTMGDIFGLFPHIKLAVERE